MTWLPLIVLAGIAWLVFKRWGGPGWWSGCSSGDPSPPGSGDSSDGVD